jgi:NAD(P)-dependent dehydrogenase (short-subunit alcohol dehydrogenase family)
MRILLLGSTGVLGRAVQAALSERHEILGASRHGPALSADLGDPASLASLLDRASQHDSSPLDAVVCTAGESGFGPLAAMTDESLVAGLRPKLLGQITLACLAFARLNECGSVTLTSGVLNQRPIRGCTGAPSSTVAWKGSSGQPPSRRRGAFASMS